MEEKKHWWEDHDVIDCHSRGEIAEMLLLFLVERFGGYFDGEFTSSDIWEQVESARDFLSQKK